MSSRSRVRWVAARGGFAAFAIGAPFALALGLSACAGAALPVDARTTPLAARFAQDDARRAQQLAPDLYARAERAMHDARDAADSAARADHVTRADLLLRAAIAESDRITAERSAAASDARAELASEQRAAFEHERLALEQNEQRELQAQAARAEAQRVFQPSAPSAGKTANHSALARAALDAERDRSAKLLRERAALTLAAAIALGLDTKRADALEHAIAQLEHTTSATARLSEAERALSDAERALGEARSALPGPTPEELATLLATASERGLHARSSPRGVIIGLDAAFAGGSAEPSAEGKRLLASLAGLARAHPKGPIQLETHAASAATSAAQRSDRARAERVRAALVGQTEALRIVFTPVPAGDESGERVQAVFTAYALATPKTAL